VFARQSIRTHYAVHVSKAARSGHGRSYALQSRGCNCLLSIT